MSSAGDDDQPPSSGGHDKDTLTVVSVPVPAQSGKPYTPSVAVGFKLTYLLVRIAGNKRPLSKHKIALNKIKWECAVALRRRRDGEITTDQFLEIANGCIERAARVKQPPILLCERANRGEVSLEEFTRECGYSEED
ncbi:hypothetical protein EVG20_g6469 [Dentipellis fragilis]|uniref:Uncharacterized protein n=1 Tax=Dentipellis fragilis TaxID=205917 RepID=A0A4Y9YKL1_9AGAM|nr:hypothetical protein EVG20_g6469 [Dentipellis fragilis]